MTFTKEYNPIIEGLNNEITIKKSVISTLKLYQNNNLIKKKKSSSKGVTYEVKDSEGKSKLITIKGNGFTPLCITYDNNKTVQLERDLTSLEKILAFIPIVIVVLGIALIGGLGGIIGGALIGFSVAISLLIGGNQIRDANSMSSKIGRLVLVGIIVYIIYLFLSTLIGALLGVAFLSIF